MKRSKKKTQTKVNFWLVKVSILFLSLVFPSRKICNDQDFLIEFGKMELQSLSTPSDWTGSNPKLTTHNNQQRVTVYRPLPVSQRVVLVVSILPDRHLRFVRSQNWWMRMSRESGVNRPLYWLQPIRLLPVASLTIRSNPFPFSSATIIF